MSRTNMLKAGLVLAVALASTEASAGVTNNGTYLNGTYLNGTYLNGTYLNGTTMSGVSVNSVGLSGSKLVGTLSGVAIEGTGFIGARMTTALSNGLVAELRIDTVQTNPNSADTWLYGISIYQQHWQWTYSGGAWFLNLVWGWDPICGSSGGVTNKATALRGRWNYEQGVPGGGSKISNGSSEVTFACHQTALGKCAIPQHSTLAPNGVGYKPWSGHYEGAFVKNWYWNGSAWAYTWVYQLQYKSYVAIHQACTRMIRADYCGDGTSNTVDGTEIDVWDNLPNPIQNQATSWTSEATWLSNGASCMNCARTDQFDPADGCANGHGYAWLCGVCNMTNDENPNTSVNNRSSVSYYDSGFGGIELPPGF